MAGQLAALLWHAPHAAKSWVCSKCPNPNPHCLAATAPALPAVEEQLKLVYSSGRPFELIDVRVVDEHGADVPRDSDEVSVCVGGGWVGWAGGLCMGGKVATSRAHVAL